MSVALIDIIRERRQRAIDAVKVPVSAKTKRTVAELKGLPYYVPPIIGQAAWRNCVGKVSRRFVARLHAAFERLRFVALPSPPTNIARRAAKTLRTVSE